MADDARKIEKILKEQLVELFGRGELTKNDREKVESIIRKFAAMCAGGPEEENA